MDAKKRQESGKKYTGKQLQEKKRRGGRRERRKQILYLTH